MTNTTNQKDSSAASGECPYFGYSCSGARCPQCPQYTATPAPQAATPPRVREQADERVLHLFEGIIGKDPQAFQREGETVYQVTKSELLEFCAALTRQAAPEAPTDRQNMTRAEMLALCAANPAAASGLPLKYPVAAGDSTSATPESERVVWWPLGPYAEQRAPAPSREAAPLDEIHSAASDLLKYLDDHDWGGIPEGATADRLRAAVAQQGAAQGGTTGKGEQRGK